MKKNKFEMLDCVMNNRTGKVYRISTNSRQTRNRWQLRGFELRNPEIARIAESKLIPISETSACICAEAERIERWKRRQNKSDREILLMARAIREKIVR